jgi:hypothetical protein
MLRLVSLVTLKPGTDVSDVVKRARAVIAGDPDHLSGEVGQGLGLMRGRLPEASYAVIDTFTDVESLSRYSASTAHREFARFVRSSVEGLVVVQYETSGPVL